MKKCRYTNGFTQCRQLPKTIDPFFFPILICPMVGYHNLIHRSTLPILNGTPSVWAPGNRGRPFHHGSSEEVFFLFFAGGACGSDFRFVISVWKEFACNINSSKTCQLCCVGSHLTLSSCSKWSNFSLVRSSASWFDSRGIQSSVKLHRDNSESSMMKTVKGNFVLIHLDMA